MGIMLLMTKLQRRKGGRVVFQGATLYHSSKLDLRSDNLLSFTEQLTTLGERCRHININSNKQLEKENDIYCFREQYCLSRSNRNTVGLVDRCTGNNNEEVSYLSVIP